MRRANIPPVTCLHPLLPSLQTQHCCQNSMRCCFRNFWNRDIWRFHIVAVQHHPWSLFAGLVCHRTEVSIALGFEIKQRPICWWATHNWLEADCQLELSCDGLSCVRHSRPEHHNDPGPMTSDTVTPNWYCNNFGTNEIRALGPRAPGVVWNCVLLGPFINTPPCQSNGTCCFRHILGL